ncbi:MAG: MFS transporter [Candidatus Bathyarchaeota archaeon]|nr:MAG: MFS transporter [Candidatus Bathyarchaeota archaeon]
MLESFRFMRGNILVMTVCDSLWRISSDIMWPYLSLYVLHLGGRYETIGQVMAVGSIASMILYPLGGYIADYQGRIKLMGYMTFFYAASFLIPALTNSWQMLAVGMFIQSFVTFYFPAMQALRADSLPPGQRGIGFATTMAIPGAIGIASPMIGGWLIDNYGIGRAIHGLYLLGFFVGILVAFIRLRFLKETVEKPNQIEISMRSAPGLLIESYGSIVRTLREAPRHLMTLSVLISFSVFFVAMVGPFWIVRAREVIGITTQQWGTLMLIVGAINVLVSIPAGGLVDRLNKKWVVGLSLIFGAMPTLLFLWITDFNQLLLLSVFTTLPNVFLNPAMQAIFADMTPREQRGRIMASLGAGAIWLMGGAWGSGIMGMLLMSAGTLMSGYLYNYDSSLPWYVLSAALVVMGMLFIALVKEPEEAEL